MKCQEFLDFMANSFYILGKGIMCITMTRQEDALLTHFVSAEFAELHRFFPQWLPLLHRRNTEWGMGHGAGVVKR